MKLVWVRGLGMVAAFIGVAWVTGCRGDVADDIRNAIAHNGGQGSSGAACGAMGGSGGRAPANQPAPQLIAPLSGSLASTALPTLRWKLAAGTDGAVIDICADRACANPIQQVNAIGNSATPSAPLPAGPVFWRARGAAGGVAGTTASPVWELFIPHRVTAASTAVATRVDLDGDGYTDFILEGRVLLGGPSGFAGSLPIPPGPADALGSTSVAAGDVNGDGFGDLMRLDQTPLGTVGLWTPNVLFGGPEGFTPGTANLMMQMTGAAYATEVAGDVNGDGYADSVFKTRFNLTAYYGGPAGIAEGPAPVVATSQGFPVSDGDVNGDGFSDAISNSNGEAAIDVTLGSSGGFLPTANQVILPVAPATGLISLFDANGDGYADAAIGLTDGVQIFAGSPSGLGATPFVTLAGSFLTPIDAADFNGDGQPDVLVETTTPTLEVHYGHGGVPDATGVTLSTPASFAVSPVIGAFGDVNGDGFDDLTVGVFTLDPVTQQNHLSSALLFLGGAGGLAVTGIPAS